MTRKAGCNDFDETKRCFNCMNYMFNNENSLRFRDDEFEFLYYYNKIHGKQKCRKVLDLIKAIGNDEEF